MESRRIFPAFLVLLGMINVGNAIECYDCYYKADGGGSENCLYVDEETKHSDCDIKDTNLDACIETISEIDGIFAMHRGCTKYSDLHCDRGNDLHGVYCCQANLCNDKGPDEIGGRTSPVTEASSTSSVTETSTTSLITETSTTSPITEDSSAITVTKASASVLFTAAACLYNMA